MAAAANRSDVRVPVTPWWLVLIEGIAAIIVGILLWMYPVRAFYWVTVFIGFYWIISGIFDLISIFIDHRAWGWKLFMGIVGILAGGFLVSQTIAGAITLAIVTVWIIGLGGIFYGILGLIRAFQGAGWGAGILGVVSIIFGIFILSNRLASALAIPWMFGFLAIFGGLLAIFGAFSLRKVHQAAKAQATQAQTPAPTPPAAVVASAAAVAAATAPEVAARFESVPVEVASADVAPAAVAPIVAGATVAAVAAVAPVEEAAPPVAETVAVVEETAVVEEPVAAVEEAGGSMAEVTAGEAVAAVEETGGAAEAVAAAAVVEETVAAVKEPDGVVTEVAVVEETTVAVAEKAAEVGEAAPPFEIPDVVDIPAAQSNFLKKEIEYVEGIGPVYGAKLKAIGINSPLDLLRKGATRKGRELIVEASGIAAGLILKWVNHADLFRLRGVGSEYADLLEAAGVDTVVELAQRNPANLHNKMVATNEEKKLVRQLPSAAQVEEWVSEAKQLDRVVTY